MTVVPRPLTQFHLHKGGSALRLDHYQILVPDVRKACEFYMEAGFWLTEYLSPGNSGEFAGVFLARKGNPHDIVFFKEKGPRLHHAAFTAPESRDIMHACDARARSASARASSAGPDGTDRATRSMFICAIPTATGWRSSTRTTRRWTSKWGRCAGTRPIR